MTQTLVERDRGTAFADADLDECGVCGHSRRNHDDGLRSCARSLCDCGAFAVLADGQRS